MQNNNENMNDEPNLPSHVFGKNAFDLPSDYFALFEDKIKHKIELENELANFPTLQGIEKAQPFFVPNQYFEQITNTLSINYKLHLVNELNDYKNLNAINKSRDFFVPESYFETFGERLKNRVYSSNTNTQSILDRFINFIFEKKVAFAFSAILVLGFSVYLYKSSQELVIETTDCKTLACLERQEILDNNQTISNFEEDQLIDLVDVNTLNVQLNSNHQQVPSHQNLQTNFDSLSDEDLINEIQ